MVLEPLRTDQREDEIGEDAERHERPERIIERHGISLRICRRRIGTRWPRRNRRSRRQSERGRAWKSPKRAVVTRLAAYRRATKSSPRSPQLPRGSGGFQTGPCSANWLDRRIAARPSPRDRTKPPARS